MKRAVLISGIAILTLSGTLAFAAGQGGHGKMGFDKGPRHSFEELDANADGKLTQEEMKAHAKARFDAADTDKNGALSADELSARMQAEASERAGKFGARMIEKRDANDDGELSLEEMGPRDGGERMFSRMDADGDGAISAEEFAEMQAHGKKHRDGRGKQRKSE